MFSIAFQTLAANTTANAPANPRILPEEVKALESLAGAEFFVPLAILVCGVLMLFFGYKAYKPIVVINCLALGYGVGSLLGESAQITIVAGVIGGLVMGAVAWPLMKYAVSVCGGLVGAIIGMIAWTYFLPQHAALCWAGGLAGMILFGMLSFILFKTNVIFFTCVQGAAMTVLGVSALLLRYTPADMQHDIHHNLTQKPILMPLLTAAVAILGILFQQQKHGLLGNDGAPAGKSGAKSEPAKK
jgi:hypothetical protein